MSRTPPIPPSPRKQQSAARQAFADRLGDMGTTSPDNMNKPELEGLNFKLPPELRREFKTTAARYGISMRDLLEQSFRLWQEKKANEQR